jgi:hypothetical protein
MQPHLHLRHQPLKRRGISAARRRTFDAGAEVPRGISRVQTWSFGSAHEETSTGQGRELEWRACEFAYEAFDELSLRVSVGMKQTGVIQVNAAHAGDEMNRLRDPCEGRLIGIRARAGRTANSVHYRYTGRAYMSVACRRMHFNSSGHDTRGCMHLHRGRRHARRSGLCQRALPEPFGKPCAPTALYLRRDSKPSSRAQSRQSRRILGECPFAGIRDVEIADDY